MKKKLMELLTKKESRKAELGTKANSTEDIKELRSINTELDTLNTEITELRSMIDALPDEAEENPLEQRSQTIPVGQLKPMGTYGFDGKQNEQRSKELTDKFEARGADLKAGKAIVVSMEESAEERAVTIASGDLIVQKKYANNLNETFNEVSSLIDRVNAVPLPGGESYTKGFEVSFGEGDYTTETGDYTDTDPVTDYVEIGKAKITAYTEITDEATKLPNINYQALVAKNVRIAIRKKLAKMIFAGAGGANAFVGIKNAPANVIPAASDIEISEIDEDTLDKIVFGYGGDEDVEGTAVLILSKADLAAFAAIRTLDGEKLYEITINGNTGTISSKGSFSVQYILNSVCPALSAVATAAGTYCMAYGNLMSYEMPVFSPLTIEESRDFKFKSGQIAYRGSIWAGGNVAAYKGFVRIKKVAAT
jgi:HK97 family phage major capsid protein